MLKISNFIRKLFMSEEQVEQAVETIVNSPEVEQAVEQATETVPGVVSETEPAQFTPAVDSSVPVDFFFEGAKVVRALDILPDGTHLCEMSDGTTKHVPAEIFN